MRELVHIQGGQCGSHLRLGGLMLVLVLVLVVMVVLLLMRMMLLAMLLLLRSVQLEQPCVSSCTS